MKSLRSRGGALFAALALLVVPLAACEPNPPPICTGEGEEPTFSAAQAGDDPCAPPPECDDCGGIHGDPHITTHDDRYYNLMLVGEFVGLLGDGTEVQFRFGPYGSSRVVSVLAGVAFDLDGTPVSITRDTAVLNDGAAVAVGGEAVDLAEGPWVRGDARVDLTDAGEIVVRSGDGLLAIITEHGFWLDLAIRTDDDVAGLLGSNDGDPDNDLTTRDGVDLGPAPEVDELHGEFAESWRITAEESLFAYGPGESTETYTDRTFPDEVITLDDLSAEERAAAEEICRAAGVSDPAILDACVLDVAVTGDETLADSAAAMQRRLARNATGETDEGPVTAAGASWVTTLNGVDSGGVFPIVTDDETLFVSGFDPERVGALTALDASTGEERWQVSGIDPRCGVGVLGDDRLVVVGAAAGPLGADDAAAVTVLDRASGDVVASAPWERAPSTYCGPVQVVGDIAAVPDVLGRMTGWNVAATPTEAWRIELPDLAAQVAVVDDLLVGLRGGDDGGMVAFVLDPSTGTEVADVGIRGRGPVDGPHLIPLDDGVVVSLSGDVADEERPGTTSRLSLAGDALTVEWEIAGPLGALATDGDLLVGYAGSDLVGIDVAAGAERWRVDPDGFRNSRSPVLIHGGSVYEMVFGGPFLLEVSATGEVVGELTGDELFGEGGPDGASWLGPVSGDLLIVQTGDADGALMVAGVSPGA